MPINPEPHPVPLLTLLFSNPSKRPDLVLMYEVPVAPNRPEASKAGFPEPWSLFSSFFSPPTLVSAKKEVLVPNRLLLPPFKSPKREVPGGLVLPKRPPLAGWVPFPNSPESPDEGWVGFSTFGFSSAAGTTFGCSTTGAGFSSTGALTGPAAGRMFAKSPPVAIGTVEPENSGPLRVFFSSVDDEVWCAKKPVHSGFTFPVSTETLGVPMLNNEAPEGSGRLMSRLAGSAPLPEALLASRVTAGTNPGVALTAPFVEDWVALGCSVLKNDTLVFATTGLASVCDPGLLILRILDE